MLFNKGNVSFFRMCFNLVDIYYLRIPTVQILSILSPILILNEKKYHLIKMIQVLVRSLLIWYLYYIIYL